MASTSSAKKPATEQRPSDQEIVSQFNAYKQELNAIAQKLGELEMEKDEHQLVVDTMSPLDPNRKCFRMIGGALVERTVKDVLPTVQANMAGIENIIKQLVQTYKKKEEEMVEYQKK
ncbi:hypothetical protein HK102_010428 [Quaeritorhiza haematococci]|nr:hypothetical protein HK102_010428 [Quaeritorhiza haematococci]